MMHIRRQCKVCFKPISRRLALFEAKDEYECYAESYVKCFWGLCDHEKSIDNFNTKKNDKVITSQPRKQEAPYNNRQVSVINTVLLPN